MRKDFDSQSRHVIDATVRLVDTGSLPRSRDTIDLSNLGHVLPREASGGLAWAQRDTWKRRDTVHIVVNFIRQDIRCGHIQSDRWDIVDLKVEEKNEVLCVHCDMDGASLP